MTASPSLEMRTKNAHARRQPETCRFCDDTGYVAVQTRTETFRRMVPVAKGSKERELKTTQAEVEEMGSCPFCERGWYEEFGDEESQKVPPVKAPWGPEGFWMGRDVSEITPVRSGPAQPLSLGENAAHARGFLERMKGALKEME